MISCTLTVLQPMVVDIFLAASPTFEPTFEKRRNLAPFASGSALLRLSPISKFIGLGWPGIRSKIGSPTPEGLDTDNRGAFLYNVTGTDIFLLLSFLGIPGEGCGGRGVEREVGEGGGVSWHKLVPRKARFCCLLFLEFDNALEAAMLNSNQSNMISM